MDKIHLTRTGYEVLRTELQYLKSTERGRLIAAIAEARAHGDLSENAEYHAARERQSFVEGRIGELESTIGRAEIIDPETLEGPSVKFGARVTLRDEDSGAETTWQLVGEAEADASEGKLAIAAPLARALLGRENGDSVEVSTPKGVRSYEILAVVYA